MVAFYNERDNRKRKSWVRDTMVDSSFFFLFTPLPPPKPSLYESRLFHDVCTTTQKGIYPPRESLGVGVARFEGVRRAAARHTDQLLHDEEVVS